MLAQQQYHTQNQTRSGGNRRGGSSGSRAEKEATAKRPAGIHHRSSSTGKGDCWVNWASPHEFAGKLRTFGTIPQQLC